MLNMKTTVLGVPFYKEDIKFIYAITFDMAFSKTAASIHDERGIRAVEHIKRQHIKFDDNRLISLTLPVEDWVFIYGLLEDIANNQLINDDDTDVMVAYVQKSIDDCAKRNGLYKVFHE